jgi:hypothetical protein
MTCSSKSKKKTECTVPDADKVNYVELVGSVNNAACVFGVTYGYYGKTIWSTKICQNKFKVCITPGKFTRVSNISSWIYSTYNMRFAYPQMTLE